MNRAFGFAMAVPLLFICFVYIITVNFVREEEQRMSEYILTYAIDYSTDAATEEMLDAANLHTDYTDLENIRCDPEVALDVFTQVMAYNYNLPNNNKSRETITSYMPVFTVCTPDGFYIYKTVGIHDQTSWSKVTYDKAWSQKIPYMYNWGGRTVALNLAMKNVFLMNGNAYARVAFKDTGIGEAAALRSINQTISDTLITEFQKETGRIGEFIVMPEEMTTLVQVNGVKGPSVLAFIDDWDMQTARSVSAFSIGGARIEEAKKYVAYRRNGQQYYCLDKWYTGTAAAVENIYVSMEEAARAGYYYDYSMMK